MAPPLKCECGVCDRCKHRVRMRAWSAKNRAKTREWALRYRYANLADVRARDRARGYRVYDAAKVEARNKVNRAIMRGELTVAPCEVCGLTGYLEDGRRAVQAHHDDYDKPLEVRWLCIRHHGEAHRLQEAA